VAIPFKEIVAGNEVMQQSHANVIASEAWQSHTKMSSQGMKYCDNLMQMSLREKSGNLIQKC